MPSTIVFKGLFEDNKKFFNAIPKPIYLLVSEGVFYHFMSSFDGVNRCNGWLKHNNLATLKKQKRYYDSQLRAFKKLNFADKARAFNNIKKIHRYLVIFTEPVFLSYELPEHKKNQIDKNLFNYCFEIRKQYEWVHKACMNAEQKVIKQIEIDRKLPKNTLAYLTIEEFERFVSTSILPDKLAQRKNFVIIKYDKNICTITYDKNLLSQFNFGIKKQVKKFAGSVACEDKITKGKVRIIHTVNDAKKLLPGEILVASMTDPRFLFAMKKAAGIITDEGGITCHAAIVSRELKIPCIVGTKIATQLLKDRNMVELDTKNGVIKKIEASPRP